jgi:hypothetical protein
LVGGSLLLSWIHSVRFKETGRKDAAHAGCMCPASAIKDTKGFPGGVFPYKELAICMDLDRDRKQI